MEALDPLRANLRAPLALLALLSALAYPASAQQFEVTPLLLSGTPIPLPPPSPPTTVWMDGPQSWMLGYGVNADGQVGFGVGFDAPVGEEPLDNYASYGVYRHTGTTTELLAFSGDAVPHGSGRTFDRVYFVAIEASGDVIVYGRSCDEIDCLEGLYRATGSGLSTIVQSGQSLPDSATDTLGQIYSVAVAEGPIAFVTTREPSQLRAVYLWSAGALTRVALEGEPVPGTARTFGHFGSARVNSSGTVAFLGYFDPVSYSDSGAFVSEDGLLRALASTGAPVPGSGTYRVIRSVGGVDEVGNIVFEALLDGGFGIFVDSGGSLRTAVRTGQTIVPGTQVPFSFVQRPAIHDGRVSFYGYYDNPQGANLYGIFAEVDDGTLARVVYEGQQTPQSLSGDFLNVGTPAFTPTGEILFFASFGAGYPDTSSGLFRARFAPGVPALGAPALALLAAALVAAARLRLRRDA